MVVQGPPVVKVEATGKSTLCPIDEVIHTPGGRREVGRPAPIKRFRAISAPTGLRMSACPSRRLSVLFGTFIQFFAQNNDGSGSVNRERHIVAGDFTHS